MKNRAFTLVELLAVLTILAVIVMIVMVSVDSIVDTARNGLSDVQIKEVEKAANYYYNAEGDMDAPESCVTINQLILKGYLDSEKIVDPKDKEEMEGSVRITRAGEQTSFKYQNQPCE